MSDELRLALDPRPSTAVRFTVLGVAAPKGSTKAYGFHRRDGSIAVNVQHDNPKTKDWQQAVTVAAQQQCGGVYFDDKPVRLAVWFFLPRPASLPRRVVHHTKKPDLDKLVRAVKDALTGVLWRDDSQVVDVVARKGYATTQPHVRIVVDYAAVLTEQAIAVDLFDALEEG